MIGLLQSCTLSCSSIGSSIMVKPAIEDNGAGVGCPVYSPSAGVCIVLSYDAAGNQGTGVLAIDTSAIRSAVPEYDAV